MNIIIQRWLPAIAAQKRRAILAMGTLALTGGLIAAPATAAQADPAAHVAPHTAAAVQQLVEQASANQADTPAADKPGDAKASAPSTEQLMPGGTPAGQDSFNLNAEQLDNAKKIIEAGKQMNLPPRAWVIAIATSLQESKLVNLGHLGARNDHDSLGLFQQRPSSGWGTPEQITDPIYSAKAFYKGLANVPGYQHMPLTRAAQTVQVSAYPSAYAKWEKMAADIVQATYGTGPYAAVAQH